MLATARSTLTSSSRRCCRRVRTPFPFSDVSYGREPARVRDAPRPIRLVTSYVPSSIHRFVSGPVGGARLCDEATMLRLSAPSGCVCASVSEWAGARQRYRHAVKGCFAMVPISRYHSRHVPRLASMLLGRPMAQALEGGCLTGHYISEWRSPNGVHPTLHDVSISASTINTQSNHVDTTGAEQAV